MSHSANDSFLFAVHLAVGVLDNFPFFPDYTEETIILCWGHCYWASLCSLHSESKILAGMRVAAIQPRVTWDTEKLACQWPIRGEFLNSAETGIQFLAMKCHILLFWLNYLLSSFHIKIMNIEILIMFYHCFKSSPSHFSFTGLYIPIFKYQFHGILQGQLIRTKDFTNFTCVFSHQILPEKFQGDWSEFYLMNLYMLTSKRWV